MADNQKYWFNGLPFQGVKNASANTSGGKFWFNGLPEQNIFPADTETGGTSSIAISWVELSFVEEEITSITGTLVATEAADTANFAGEIKTSGALAVIEAADTAIFAGEIKTSGALAVVEAADTATFSGSAVSNLRAVISWVQLSALETTIASGSLVAVETADVATFTGTVQNQVYSGPLVAVEAADIATFIGTVVNSVFSGPLVAVEAIDITTFTGTVVNSVFSGPLVAVEANDIASFIGTVINAQSYLRPDADTSRGGWVDQADGTTDIYNSIDETSYNDTDYVKSPAVVGSSIDLLVRLFEGSTEIAEWTHNDVSEVISAAEQTLTTPQFEAISNFSNLFVEFDDNQGDVYRFGIGNPTLEVTQPVRIRYRYAKLAA